jgi:prophage regulatory protein
VKAELKTSDAYLSIQDVRNSTGLGRSTIYRMVENGEFPKSYQLSARRVGWKKSEIDAWNQDREVNAPTAKFGSHRGRKVVRMTRKG